MDVTDVTVIAYVIAALSGVTDGETRKRSQYSKYKKQDRLASNQTLSAATRQGWGSGNTQNRRPGGEA